MPHALYTSILDATLIPFINSIYPNGHRFMQDNDPKHTPSSRHAADYMRVNGVNWWKTPPESPDCNPMHRKPVARAKRIPQKRNKTQDQARTDRWNTDILENSYYCKMREIHRPSNY